MSKSVILSYFAQNPDQHYLGLLKEEYRLVKQAWLQHKDANKKGYYEVDYLDSPFTKTEDIPTDIKKYQDSMVLFHYGGHAGGKKIFLEDGAGQGSGLAGLLGEAKNLRMVFLNGCATYDQVDVLFRHGVKVVLATNNHSAPDNMAQQFAATFYGELSKEGTTIQKAYNLSRYSLEFDGAFPANYTASATTWRELGFEQHDDANLWQLFVYPGHEALLNNPYWWVIGNTALSKPEEPNLEENLFFRLGQLDYEIPDVMQQNQSVMCTIRLAGTEVAPEDFRISETSIHADIQITNEMSVRLVDPSDGVHFSIAAISSKRQAIRRGSFTEWKISVTPLKAGTFSLCLRISAHFDGKTQDMKVLEKSIRVTGDTSQTLKQIESQIRKKIVFLAADADKKLLLELEANSIREELLMSTRRDDFLYTTISAVTGLNFSRMLLIEKPTIVHFSGHGSAKGIYLVNKERQAPQLAPTAALQKLFELLQKALKIECLILNACFSKAQAKGLVQSIPVVVGTQSKIGDKEAINFSLGFYQGLGGGLAYDEAFELGRVQVSFNSDDEDAEDVLVLLKKSL